MKDEEVSFLKGLGILCVVLSHCYANSVVFTSGFLITIFFFVAGITYSEEKYSGNISGLVGNRLYSTWKNIMPYMIIMIILHNTFYSMGIFAEGNSSYDLSLMLMHIFRTPLMEFEPLNGAVWFMAPYITSVIMYGLVVFLINKIDLKIELYKDIVIFVFCFLLGIIGICMIKGQYIQSYRTEISFLCIPIIALGHLYKKYVHELKCRIHLLGFVMSSLVIIASYMWTRQVIRLGSGIIINSYIFYPLVVVSIYWCLTLYYLVSLKNVNFIKKTLSFVGKYSLDIMVLHIVVFKCIDYLYCKLFKVDIETLSTYPAAFSKLIVVYVFLGILLPILIRRFFNMLCRKIEILIEQKHN